MQRCRQLCLLGLDERTSETASRHSCMYMYGARTFEARHVRKAGVTHMRRRDREAVKNRAIRHSRALRERASYMYLYTVYTVPGWYLQVLEARRGWMFQGVELRDDACGQVLFVFETGM